MRDLGTASVIRANSRSLPLADNSVDLVVTSPPYFALRSYQDGGEHYAGQIGSEASPSEFVAALLAVTRECVRVLKPSGSLWVNLGDKYVAGTSAKRPASSPARETGGYASGQALHASDQRLSEAMAGGVRTKSLIGIPWRYALACIDDLGLILRAEVVWSKPNGLPESVTDRVRRSHEQWFHFTLSPRYFSAVDEIREEHVAPPKKSGMAKLDGRSGQVAHTLTSVQNPLGKLPGSVWTVPTEPLKVPDHLGIDHFAAFPTEWPKRIIQGWSPAGVCVACGEGRRPVVEPTAAYAAKLQASAEYRSHAQQGWGAHGGSQAGFKWHPGQKSGETSEREITGYACACPEPTADTTPAVVLDPFGGTGTTAMVAKALGRHGISVDMSADYCRLAQWRTNDRNQLAKVLGIEKTDEPDPEQLDLFGGVA